MTRPVITLDTIYENRTIDDVVSVNEELLTQIKLIEDGY